MSDMSENSKIAQLLFPTITTTFDQYIAKFPKRKTNEGDVVTRFAPSPTGFMHLGSLYAALIAERFAHVNKGTFFLRIEDTDQKREVEGGIEKILNTLKTFDITIDEGVTGELTENGEFGPYKQTLRQDIYANFAKHIIEIGQGYACFLTPEDLAVIRTEQESKKIRPGIYGQWAKYRDSTYEEVKSKIDTGTPFVIRLKSQGNSENKSKFDDLIRGSINITQNDLDYVLLKSDGLPTYHFAHLVDDYLMGTTHVIRAEEWLPSLPVHLELFDAFGFVAPKYAHISQIMKMDNGAKRKLSKRKDPEANMEYYNQIGMPHESVIEYLMNIANSNFEDWRKLNPQTSYKDFEFKLNKINPSGALFDLVKLDDVSKNFIGNLSSEEVYQRLTDWLSIYDTNLLTVVTRDKNYSLQILGLERGSEKSRKDLSKWSDFSEMYFYFYDDLFEKFDSQTTLAITSDIKALVGKYAEFYKEAPSKEEWFEQIKAFARQNDYCPDMKQYKTDPTKYKGSVADVTGFIRLAVTKKDKTPDLYTILKILGYDKVVSRLKSF